MRASVPVVLLLVLNLALLSACGLKDDLYLPAQPVEQTATPESAPSESEDSDEPHAENPRT